MNLRRVWFITACLFIFFGLIACFQETALARPRLDTCASRFGCTPQEVHDSDSQQEAFQNNLPKMTKTVEFKVTVTPPLVDTASGSLSVMDKMPHLKESGKLIIFPKTAEEKDRGMKLGRSSDMGTFTFVVDESSLSLLCQKIATGILSETGIRDNKILVEGSKADSVISLKNIDAKELSDRIFAIVIAN